MSEQKLKQLWSLGKKRASKGPETEKKVWLGLNPLLRWLSTVCLRGFDTAVTVFSLHQCLKRAVMNEQKQLSISNHHSWVPRWRAFNFAQVLFRSLCLECQVTVLSKLTCMQKVLILKKICSTAGFEPATSWMPVSCTTNWVIDAVVVSVECCLVSFSTFYRGQTEHRMSLRW